MVQTQRGADHRAERNISLPTVENLCDPTKGCDWEKIDAPFFPPFFS